MVGLRGTANAREKTGEDGGLYGLGSGEMDKERALELGVMVCYSGT
ncbi:MAG: hypothetical protein SWK76_09120 [Actinomycetota bacterium]|nr:hypothetical protein [Actinomycetota bacterium]